MLKSQPLNRINATIRLAEVPKFPLWQLPSRIDANMVLKPSDQCRNARHVHTRFGNKDFQPVLGDRKLLEYLYERAKPRS